MRRPATRHAQRFALRSIYILVRAVLITLALAALLAAGLNRWYWGYWISRPGIDARVLHARALISLTLVVPDSAGSSPELIPTTAPEAALIYPAPGFPDWQQGPYPGPGWYDHPPYGNESDYYLLDLRALRALEQSGRVRGPLPSVRSQKLAGLMSVVKSTGVLATEDSGYRQWKPGVWAYSGGAVYELVAQDDTPLLLVALRGGETSNDHHPYYELLFAPQPTGPPRLLSARHFFFDVAGIEGADFLRLFPLLALVGLAAVVPACLYIILTTWLKRLLRRRRGHCPLCDYDLRGLPTPTCPECGAATPTSQPRCGVKN